MNKIIALFIVITLFVIVFGIKTFEEESRKFEEKIKDFETQNHPIKEMSVDMITSGKVGGGFLLVGGSIYGSIDTQREITIIYGTNKNGETIYKTTTLPLDDIEIVTVDASNTPNLKIIEGSSLDIETLHYKIRRARLYLPNGWQLIK